MDPNRHPEDLLHSPVPLQKEEADSEEVQKLARALAPVLLQTEELFQVPDEFRDSDPDQSANDNDDDDYSDEENLGEDALRQELELAQDFSNMFGLEEAVPTTPKLDPPEKEATPNDALKTPHRLLSTPMTPATPKTPVSLDNSSMFDVPSTGKRKQGVPMIHYTASDHAELLNVSRLPHSTTFLLDHGPTTGYSEFIQCMPENKLKQLYTGYPHAEPKHNTQWPVRTVRFAIRPDVLCGAVMEAIVNALIAVHAHMTKRQGGHVVAIVPAVDIYHGYRVDVRLVTEKTSDECVRVLMVRMYYNNTHDSDNNGDDDDNNTDDPNNNNNTVPTEEMAATKLDARTAILLRESAALVQRILTPELAKNIPPTLVDVKSTVSDYLLRHYRACPSVRLKQNKSRTFPSLNADDFEVIVSASRLLGFVSEELQTRDLLYSTLSTCRFGSFPSLPSLDVHYCSQIRRISREFMTNNLIKRAKELEQYAREAEWNCANMIALLKPTFEAYEVDPPSLPTPKQLSEYPLEYELPQEACPPWGEQVQHALNEVQAMASAESIATVGLVTELSQDEVEVSHKMANVAVRLVFEAFSRQDDQEQSARLQRKNMQVLDRLEKMQRHEKESIRALEHCAAQSRAALAAAEAFHSKTDMKEVPLVKWSILVGSATGTLTFTAHHLLFSTQRIPVLGGISNSVYKIEDVELVVNNASQSLLNPLPTSISLLQGNKEVLKFRPSMGGPRLKSFFDVVKTAETLD